jgi:hypothetical protein
VEIVELASTSDNRPNWRRWRRASKRPCQWQGRFDKDQISPRAKLMINSGVAVSKPTTSSMPASAGHAKTQRKTDFLAVLGVFA